MGSVLFVCTGNICRSPMAMTIFKELLAKRLDGPAWRVESAGIWAGDNMPASSFSRMAMKRWGLDLTGHRSRIVTGELLDSFNLIITMEQGQKEALLVEFPRLDGKVYLLSELAGSFGDIDDPYGSDHLADYEATAGEIAALLTKGFERIIRLGSAPVS